MKKVLLLFLGLFPAALFGQVFFINADTLPTNVVDASTLPATSLSVSAALIRFVPEGKNTAFKGKLPTMDGFAGALKALGKEGRVALLYLGTRSQDGRANGTISFHSLERRPAFSLAPTSNGSVTTREFGLQLRLRARPETNQQIHLEWEGSFSWSNDLINLWAGDKYLMFGMTAAKLLKPGLVFTEGGEDEDEPEQKGINLRSLFGKKKEAKKPEPAAANVSFLDTDFQQVTLVGQQQLPSRELAVFSYTAQQAKETNAVIYLLLQPMMEP